ncbi:MAG: acetylxylan esterase [Verrucomicrobiae bacterium]|nr:acetylxylan esterase [Verrucomicrobiae bacterium]
MLPHSYPFDPSYGHDFDSLLAVGTPDEPPGFVEFWKRRYERARSVDPSPRLGPHQASRRGWKIRDLSFTSTGETSINGWLLIPESGEVRRGFVVSHGYGGRDAPDFHLPFKDAALLFPCSRGLGRSRHPSLPSDPGNHVIHGISDPEQYLLGNCVEDLWTAASALLNLFPEVEGHLGFLGISFGGGTGAMAMPWDDRFQRAHFNVPSFGNQPLRLELPTTGSGASVQRLYQKRPEILETLLFHDAAIAARHIRIPVHGAYALFDPMVAPPGQFSIHNSLGVPGSCFPLTAGHHPYPGQLEEDRRLLREIDTFFQDL